MAYTVVAPPLGFAQRHARRLAALHGASPSAIADTIALWPLGVRLSLSAHNIIDYNAGEDAAAMNGPLSSQDVRAAASRGEPLDFGITDRGLDFIADCARWAAHDDDADVEAPEGHDWPEALATSEELEEVRLDAASD